MVGPISDDERRVSMNKLKAIVVVLVGASGGLVALSRGGTLAQAALATVAGLAVGAVLLWYLVRITN